jgi:HK97 family phage portal protein
MSLLDDIRQRISNAILPSGKKLQRPYQSTNSYRQVASLPQGNELAMSLRGTVFACLQHRANALSAIQFNTFKEQNFAKSELGNDNWAAHLIANPNPYFTRSQVFSFIENWLSINGNCFIWTPTIGYKVPLQMWVLNPTRVRVIIGGDNFVQGYTYQSATEGLIPIPEKEMIHLARVHPAARPDEIIGMNIFGVGLVTAALDYANIDLEVSEYLHRLFANNAVPPLIATFPERFDIEEWHKLKASWNEELPNYKLRALLGGGMQLQLPPKSELGVNYDSVSKDTRAQIAQVFGVPPGMLTGEFQNRATAEVQFAIFRQNTIDPEAIYIAEEFTRHFRRFEEDILIEPVPYAYADPELDMKKEEFELKWGIKTINDSRKERGYDAIEGGNVALIGNGYIPLDNVGAPKAVSTFALRSFALNKRAKLPIITADSKDAFWRDYDLLTEKSSVKIDTVVQEIIQQLKQETLSNIDKGYLSLANLEVSDQDYEKFNALVEKACLNVQNELLKSFDLKEQDLTGTVGEQIKNLANESSEKITSSVGLMKAEIAQLIESNAGSTKEELKEKLQTKFQQLSEGRAKTIANTTSANVTSGMQHAVYQDLGFKMMWLTQRDGLVRPAHREADGAMQGADGYFTVGGEKTTRPLGSGLSAGNAVNCRCQIFPVED